MTHSHFVAIADALRQADKDVRELAFGDDSIPADVILPAFVAALLPVLQGSNPRFDVEKFKAYVMRREEYEREMR